MRAAFFGTPAAAIPSLAALAEVADVGMVITQPDAARGRSGKPMPPPVKVAALEWGFALAQPETSAEILESLRTIDIDVAVVVAYGRILRPDVLASVPLGLVNVHFSLLPRWRGAAPVERAILEGDERTGVTLMVLDEGMDTGPLLGAYETTIGESETGGSLTARLAHAGAVMLADVLPSYTRGKVAPAPQMSSGATHARRLTTPEAQLTVGSTVEEADRKVRAFNPRPGAWAIVDGVRTKIFEVGRTSVPMAAGRIEVIDHVPILGLGDGALELRSVQPAGKRPLSGAEWANGRQGAPAELSDV